MQIVYVKKENFPFNLFKYKDKIFFKFKPIKVFLLIHHYLQDSTLETILKDPLAMSDGCKNVLLGLTGSVASIKTEEIVSLLKQSGFNVKVIATENSLRFFDKSKLDVPVFTDRDENECWKQRSDPVLHIEVSLIPFS